MTTTTVSELNIIELSDIHLGHKGTPTISILKGLYRLLRDTPSATNVDMIVLAGDVFDRELTFPDDDLLLIRKWIHDLLLFCKKHDIVLRVLEGTPSHDWKQSFEFEHINEQFKIGVDVKHVRLLYIEHIDSLNIDVLYVPDEWRTDNSQTWLEVQELMAQKGLDKVDFAIMHGAFPHQMPDEASKWMQFHNPDNYLSIVRYHIFVGHIHRYSQYDRILSAGSFDRLAHGEEGEKGYLYYTLHSNGKCSIRFIVNRDSTIYKTIDLRNKVLDECLDLVIEIVNSYTEESHVRLWIERSEGLSQLLLTLRRMYPNFIWTTKVTEANSSKNESSLSMVVYRPIQSLTTETLPTAVIERLKTDYPQYLDICTELLKRTMFS